MQDKQAVASAAQPMEQLRQQLLTFEAANKVAQHEMEEKAAALSCAESQVENLLAAKETAAVNFDQQLRVSGG